MSSLVSARVRTLFGLPPREGAEPEGQQVLQLAAAADGDMDDPGCEIRGIPHPLPLRR